MKRILLCLLCLVLAGCQVRSQPPQATAPQNSVQTEATAGQTLLLETTVPETTLPETAIPLPEPDPGTFVRVQDYIPDIQVELRYATENNFTGQAVYGFDQAWLRYGTVKKLMGAQDFFRSQGLSLKIWDAYRPVSAQFALWDACPNGTYVANPNTTYSAHSRGNTLDVTLVDSQGRELEMPTGFDDFSPLADRDYSDCSLVTAENARLLQNILEQQGFSGYKNEWWHFTDTDSYDVELEFSP